jgi:hypothetical protein
MNQFLASPGSVSAALVCLLWMNSCPMTNAGEILVTVVNASGGGIGIFQTYDLDTGLLKETIGDANPGSGGGGAYLGRDSVFVTEGGSVTSSIWHYRRTGTTWALASPEHGRFQYGSSGYTTPLSVATSHENKVVVVFQNSHKVIRFNGTLNPAQFNTVEQPPLIETPDVNSPVIEYHNPSHQFPQAAAFHPLTGELYVVFFNGKVVRASGPEVVTVSGARNIAFDAGGFLLVATVSRINRYDSISGAPFGAGGNTSDATFIAAGLGGLGIPTGMAVDTAGRIYVGNLNNSNPERHGVLRYLPDGTVFGAGGDTDNAVVAAAGMPIKWIALPPEQRTTNYTANATVHVASQESAERYELVLKALNNARIVASTDPARAQTYLNALGISADPGAKMQFTIPPATTLNAGRVEFGTGALVELKGDIKADVSVGTLSSVGQRPEKYLLDGAAALIGSDAASVVSNDGAGLVGLDGASLVSDLGGRVLSHNGNSVIPAQGGKLIGQDGAGLVGQDGAGRLAASITAPTFTRLLVVDGHYTQRPDGSLAIAIAGNTFDPEGAKYYDRLQVSGKATLSGIVGFSLFDPTGVNGTERFAPAVGDYFDVVVAQEVAATNLLVRGPIWGDGRHMIWGVVTNFPGGLQSLRLYATNLPPPVAIGYTEHGLDVVYPTNYAGYSLETSTTLAPGSWSTQSSGTNRVTVGNGGERKFFRLFKP